MTRPNILEYARYFNLTKEYTNDYIDEQISAIQLRPYIHQQEEVQSNVFNRQEYPTREFRQAEQRYASPSYDELSPLPPDVAKYLNFCDAYSSHGIQQFLRSSIPSWRRWETSKLALPLLSIGGGDVKKDVIKIRKGIDLKRALEEVTKEYRVDLRRGRDDTLTSGDLQQRMLGFVEQYAGQIMQPAICEVTVSCLHFLKEAITNPLTRQQARSSVYGTVPKLTTRQKICYQTISVDDFALLEQDESACKSPASMANGTGYGSAPHNDTSIAPSSSSSTAEPFTGPKDSTGTTDSGVDTLAMPESWHDFINIDYTPNPTLSQTSHQPPSSTPEIHEVSSLSTTSTLGQKECIVTSPNESIHGVNTAPCTSLQDSDIELANSDMKITLPTLELYRVELGVMETGHLSGSITHNREVSDTHSFDLKPVLEQLPFKLPCRQNVLADKKPMAPIILDRYLTKPSHITVSKEMLYRNPEIPVLHSCLEEDEELQSTDFPIDDNAGHELQRTVRSGDLTPKSSNTSITDDSLELYNTISETRLHEQDIAGKQTQCLQSTAIYDLQACRTIQHANGVSTPEKCALGKRKREAEQQLGNVKDFPLTVKSCTALSVPNGRMTASAPMASVEHSSESLSSFLQLRGKKFLKTRTPEMSQAAELWDDPIQCTQSEQAVAEQHPDMSTTTAAQVAPNTVTVPQWMSLGEDRTIVLNSSLLQRKPFLVSYIEQAEPDKLTLMYRDLDFERMIGPDIILDSYTCVFITNAQALDQRPLPGQKSRTGLSETHDTVERLATTYPWVIILIYYLQTTMTSSQSKLALTLAEFADFCQKYQTIGGPVEKSVLPVWLPCENVTLVANVVKSWVWQLIWKHAHRSDSTRESETSALAQDGIL